MTEELKKMCEDYIFNRDEVMKVFKVENALAYPVCSNIFLSHQKKADAENILYQIQLIGQKKNEMLSDQVNSNFTLVKFRLFTYLKNGEIKDDCTPMVLCSDGEYRDMTYSANTAAIMAAKIDICVGLQKHYGQTLPIWVDGAECFDEENRKKLKTDRQLLLLCVTEDERLTVKK